MSQAEEKSNHNIVKSPETIDELVRLACEGASMPFAEIAKFFPPKKNHKPCYGRGFIGRDFKTKLPILCECIARPWGRATGRYLELKFAGEKRLAEDMAAKAKGGNPPTGAAERTPE